MRLSPDDIVGYTFRQQKMRGYDVDQVDDLLDQLADQVEATDRELDELRARLRDAEARLASALETESTLKRTLVTAQDAAERALAEAREQADELRETAERAIDEQLARARDEAASIVATAQRDARAELDAAREQRAAIDERVATLRDLERRHRQLLERHLRGQLAALDDLAADPDAPSNTPTPARDVPPAGPGEPSPSGEPGLTVRVRPTGPTNEDDGPVGSVSPPSGGGGGAPQP